MAGGENFGYTLVLVVSFLAVFTILLGSMGGVLTSDPSMGDYKSPQSTQFKPNFSPSEFALLSMVDPDNGYNISVVPKNTFLAGGYVVINDAGPVDFTDGALPAGDQVFHVYYKTSTHEWLVHHAHGWWDRDNFWFTEQQILDAFDWTVGRAFLSFKSSGAYNLAFFVQPGISNVSFASRLATEKNFTVALVKDIMGSQLEASASSWNIVGQLLTMSLPSVDPLVQAFIAIPMWAAIIYVSFRLIIMCIPFLA